MKAEDTQVMHKSISEFEFTLQDASEPCKAMARAGKRALEPLIKIAMRTFDAGGKLV